MSNFCSISFTHLNFYKVQHGLWQWFWDSQKTTFKDNCGKIHRCYKFHGKLRLTPPRCSSPGRCGTFGAGCVSTQALLGKFVRQKLAKFHTRCPNSMRLFVLRAKSEALTHGRLMCLPRICLEGGGSRWCDFLTGLGHPPWLGSVGAGRGSVWRVGVGFIIYSLPALLQGLLGRNLKIWPLIITFLLGKCSGGILISKICWAMSFIYLFLSSSDLFLEKI